jgi:hypothetical protein
MFALGTILSFLGWIVLAEVGTTATLELFVSAAGIATMAFAARYLTEAKASRAASLAAPSAP